MHSSLRKRGSGNRGGCGNAVKFEEYKKLFKDKNRDVKAIAQNTMRTKK